MAKRAIRTVAGFARDLMPSVRCLWCLTNQAESALDPSDIISEPRIVSYHVLRIVRGPYSILRYVVLIHLLPGR